MSYSIFEVSKVRLQIDLVGVSVSPYNTYGDANRSISLLDADDIELIKEGLMELSNRTQVSFMFTLSDPIQENNVEYYWYLQDSKYLSKDINLNKNLDVETFNSLEDPITNHATDEYHFNFPLDTYNYQIHPFSHYEESTLSSQFTIFAETEGKLDGFITGLDQLEILYVVNEPFEYEDSFLQTIGLIISENPLGPITFGLFLIAIFIVLYQDRRNLSIKLVNGYSKTRYIIENVKSLLVLEIITFCGSFLVLYFFSYYSNFKHFLPMLSYYISIMLIINLISIAVLAIIVYSFSDIDKTTYVQGVKPKAFTSFIIGISKFGIGFLICLSLIPSINNIIHTVSIYQSMSQEMIKYSDMHIIDSSGSYVGSIMEKSDEIIDALKGFDNLIYVRHFDSENEKTNKLVHVNENYMKRHLLFDENNNPVDLDNANVVYTKDYNIQWVEDLKPYGGFLCESEDNCMNVETIIVHKDTELTIYNMDPTAGTEIISQDFVLVPRNDDLFILDLFFVFENEEDIEEVKNVLKDIIDIESLNFVKITDQWEGEIQIYRNIIIRDIIDFVNYLILIVILSLIYYQIKLDKVRKEFSIYWVNGISKFKHFYSDYFYQIVLSGIMIMLVKIIFYPYLSMIFAVIVYLVFICIDTISLAIFRHRFYTQLQKNIKEQI